MEKEIGKRMFENIYDLIKGVSIPKNTKSTKNGSWAELSKAHEEEAKKELKKFVYNKNIEWDGDKNIISIGKHFKFKLLEK